MADAQINISAETFADKSQARPWLLSYKYRAYERDLHAAAEDHTSANFRNKSIREIFSDKIQRNWRATPFDDIHDMVREMGASITGSTTHDGAIDLLAHAWAAMVIDYRKKLSQLQANDRVEFLDGAEPHRSAWFNIGNTIISASDANNNVLVRRMSEAWVPRDQLRKQELS